MNLSDADILNDETFDKLIVLIHKLTGITISKNKKSMVQGRLRRRVLALKLQNYEEYFDYVLANDTEKTPFIDLVTTNETYFFRTPRIWNYLEAQFLPAWIKQKEGKKISVWSAASSTGEEAHSLGILLQQFKEKNPIFDYEVFGSDISPRVLDICNLGCYQGRSIEAFKTTKPLVFAAYMKRNSDESFSIREDIKKKIKFFEHNLFTPLRDKKIYDLILIRNVFIYFTPVDQCKVLELISPKLADDGILIIGESETLAGMDKGFLKVDNLIYKKDVTK